MSGVAADRTVLRRTALAAAVLHDIDLDPDDNGIVLPLGPPLRVSWADIEAAITDAEPDSSVAAGRLARWIQTLIAVVRSPNLREHARPVALPPGHELHPGESWVRERVLGDALEVGFGFTGVDPADTERVVVVPTRVLELANVNTRLWWQSASDYIEQMGALAAHRWRINPKAHLRSLGDCDVLTLLASRAFRSALAGDGMRACVVPMRTRGWTDIRRIDPAFALAAAAATEPTERGFDRPVLVTADEVVLVKAGGRAVDLALRDPAPREVWLRDVRYHA